MGYEAQRTDDFIRYKREAVPEVDVANDSQMTAERKVDEAFRAGFLAALELYAVWQNSVQIVGCGHRTLAQAKGQLDRVVPPQVQKGGSQ